ncbi:hypothetical protein [Actinotignum urinale]|uniref:hypothetical protein n=1 Tax=Actinotignum urinale TaxID=190146 RepID=UPI0011AED329
MLNTPCCPFLSGVFEECGKKTPEFVNCANQECRKQFLLCDNCSSAGLHPYCNECSLVK